MPMRKAEYPANWREMSRAARERAGQRCEQCGAANGAVGYRDRTGRFHRVDGGGEAAADDGERVIRIVLTVHHPDCDKGNPDARLVVLCQRDHFRADLPRHVANAAATRRRKRIERGQAALPQPLGEGA